MTQEDEKELLGKRHVYGETARSTMREIAGKIGFAPAEVSELERIYGGMAQMPIGTPAGEPDHVPIPSSRTQTPTYPSASDHRRKLSDVELKPLAKRDTGKVRT